jgi:uncharacterized protein (DUF1330 family)
MPKGYVILTEAINDPERMKAYGKAAYQKAAKLRQAAADCNAVIISGFGD